MNFYPLSNLSFQIKRGTETDVSRPNLTSIVNILVSMANEGLENLLFFSKDNEDIKYERI